MKQFRLVDNVLGWLTFFIAAFVYCSTIEPTASFWDCPEFITTGYKLEVGHPPGAPFFMLTANLFSQFTSDPAEVARMVNTMSALLSAACILFLFWSITHLVRRLLINKWEELDMPKLIAIEASGLVGALIYTFSDTFWYSAVEGEVYAYSSAFTAVVFWLILKWEEHADEPHSDRWLVLIMYMTGLSIGVHLLNLLCLPAIVLVWYYKRFPNANLKGSLVALVVSFILLAAVLYGVVPGIITVGGWFELFFVNTLHMPFNTGLFVYLALLIGSVIWAIYETQRASDKNFARQNIAFLLGFGLLGVPFIGWGWSAAIIGLLILGAIGFFLFRRKGGANGKPLISARLKNTTLLCMLMLMIGYSTYAVIVIRSSANPPMDQNSPEDIFTLGSYLSRDQYGDRPLLWGQAFDSELKIDEEKGDYDMSEGAPTYHRVEKKSADEPDSYFEVKRVTGNGTLRGIKDKYNYEQTMFFPRMYSSDPTHIRAYTTWGGGITGDIKEARWPQYRDDADWTITQDGQPYQRKSYEVVMPTFADNMRFFFSYQCGWMYWRYFMWNFAGRQNDIQGHGGPEHGNFMTGIPFIDNPRVGNPDLWPDEMKENKGYNVYYCMPLILGLIGLFWQMLGRGRKGIQQFWVVFFLFVMTGLAIVVYLNQTPYQPRERDYAYAGSFYAYAIWCGMGVAAIITWLNTLFAKKAKKNVQLAMAAAISAACLVVPIQMASQNWDDHDRSGRYTCRDFGQNYLMSLQDKGNPIIFTCGDNDTFPLWYNQDTEEVRTDARVCNLSYLNTDWYIDQMVRPTDHSPALPITWKRLEYVDGTNDWMRMDHYVSMAIHQFRALCAIDSVGVIKREFGLTPEEAQHVFDDSQLELKTIIHDWIRDQRDDATRALHTKVLKPITNWYFGISKFIETINMCFNERNEFNQTRFAQQMSSIGLSGITYNEAADLFGPNPYDTNNAEVFYNFLQNRPEDKVRTERQLKVIRYFNSRSDSYKLQLKTIPYEKAYITIDKDAVKESGMYIPKDSLGNDDLNAIPDRIEISLNRSTLNKSHLMMLELLANTNWKRPLYVATTVGQENWLSLGEYFMTEGLAYRITPYRNYTIGGGGQLNPINGAKCIDTDKMYENVMKRFKFGGVKTKGIYLDETILRMCYTHRNFLIDLAQALQAEGKNQEALDILNLSERELPAYNVPHENQGSRLISQRMAESYIQLGEVEKGLDILNQLWKKSTQYLQYYFSLPDDQLDKVQSECYVQVYYLGQITGYLMQLDSEKFGDYYQKYKVAEDMYQKRFEAN